MKIKKISSSNDKKLETDEVPLKVYCDDLLKDVMNCTHKRDCENSIANYFMWYKICKSVNYSKN